MQFCTITYNVTFPLSAKIEVNGPNRHPLYEWLTAPENGFAGDLQWNFEKFLVDRQRQADRPLSLRHEAGRQRAAAGNRAGAL